VVAAVGLVGAVSAACVLGTALSGSTVFGLPIAVIVFVVIALLAWPLLERTYLGRQVYAVGGSNEAARPAGIPTNRRVGGDDTA